MPLVAVVYLMHCTLLGVVADSAVSAQTQRAAQSHGAESQAACSCRQCGTQPPVRTARPPPPQSCVLCDTLNITTAEPVVLSCDGYLGTPAVSQATLS